MPRAQKKSETPKEAKNAADASGDGALAREPGDPNAYSVKLPTFEGPLDLLLHLCQKHELNIIDIPIGFITEKYLEYLDVMRLAAGTLGLDLAAEYLVMAATLAHIKSKMLLPAPPPGQEDEIVEEEEDPREALIRRLLEYQKYKHAGEQLAANGIAGRDVFPRGAPIEEAVHTGMAPLAEIPVYALIEAFQSVLSKSKIKITHDVVADRISITDRIHELAEVLNQRKRVMFEELFTGLTSRFDLVITFLACLEMTKLRMTRLFQSEPLAPIYIELAAGAADANVIDATEEEERAFEREQLEENADTEAASAGEDAGAGAGEGAGAGAGAEDEDESANADDGARDGVDEGGASGDSEEQPT